MELQSLLLNYKSRSAIAFGGVVLFVCSLVLYMQSQADEVDPPNIVIIFTDDQGYADLKSYGAEDFKTPNLDRLGDEGMRFTSFYSASSVCTPSRAALLTGRYPMRVGLPSVIFPRHKIGLNFEELTMAELFKQKEYATAAIGKWHLGAHPNFLPTNHGFDSFFGLPYSNDMSPEPENNPREGERDRFPPLPLIEDTTIIEREPDQARLIQRYTARAIDFIKENHDQPFFLYYAHNLPHVPLYASDNFRGTTKSFYGDVIHEIDWSVGAILKALEENELREKTLVVFTSDNGPWLVFGDHGGSAGKFREGKITTFEGGHRVPAIMSWPGKIPSGTVTDKMATTLDLFPTFANVTNANIPENIKIDGHNIWPILSGAENVKSPYQSNPFFYYLDENLEAVRYGSWKLHVAHEYLGVGEAGDGGDVGEYEVREIEQSLFNLEEDPGETKNLVEDHPGIVKKLTGFIEQGRKELGDAKTGMNGIDQGQPGKVEHYWQILDKE